MIGIFFTARLGSTRLAQKHLIDVEGRSFIQWLVGRYLHEFSKEIEENDVKVFITTSSDPLNKEFENVFPTEEVTVFYGSDANIPLRHLECATANQIEYIVSVDGDDILCSSTAAKLVIEKLKLGSEMVQTKGLPLGMNVMGYHSSFLKKSVSEYSQMKLETGWGKIFDQSKIEVIEIHGYESDNELRMTLDYEDDANFFKTVIANIGNEILTISDRDLVNRININNWQKLNIDLNKIYWDNFNKQKLEEN